MILEELRNIYNIFRKKETLILVRASLYVKIGYFYFTRRKDATAVLRLHPRIATTSTDHITYEKNAETVIDKLVCIFLVQVNKEKYNISNI